MAAQLLINYYTIISGISIMSALLHQPDTGSGLRAGPPAADARCARPVSAARWYVAQTHPNKESRAIQHLVGQGFSTFFPRFRKREVRRSADQVRLKPVFPGYVFVRLDLAAQSWWSIRSTRGVRALVGPRLGQPQAVPEPVMTYLFRRCQDEVMITLADALQPGDLVQINTGPLFNRIATVAALPASGRVALLFELLGTT